MVGKFQRNIKSFRDRRGLAQAGNRRAEGSELAEVKHFKMRKTDLCLSSDGSEMMKNTHLKISLMGIQKCFGPLQECFPRSSLSVSTNM